jgi:hypothetical protein
MDNSFLSPDLFNDMTKEFNCCRAVRPERMECHRALLAASFLLVSHVTCSSTLTVEAVVPPKHQWTSTRLHSVTYEMTVLFIGPVFHLSLADCLLGLDIDPEDGGSTFIRNVVRLLPDYMGLHPRR